MTTSAEQCERWVLSLISQVSPQIPNESKNASVDRRESENKIEPCTLYEHFLRPFVTPMILPPTSKKTVSQQMMLLEMVLEAGKADF